MPRALPIHLYRLATVSQTEGQTDHSIMPIILCAVRSANTNWHIVTDSRYDILDPIVQWTEKSSAQTEKKSLHYLKVFYNFFYARHPTVESRSDAETYRLSVIEDRINQSIRNCLCSRATSRLIVCIRNVQIIMSGYDFLKSQVLSRWRR